MQQKKNPFSYFQTTFLELEKNKFFLLFPILIITIIVFINLINNLLLISWTDQLYIIDNPEIKELSFENIKNIFTTFFVDNYHPFTNLSNAIEYHFFGLDPRPYHVNNLIIHLLNISLVYRLFLFFNKKTQYAAVAAILFAIHPMHVESVAWASERKDMLYTFFYLSSIILYIKYFQSELKDKTYYYFSVLMFLFSLLSKSAAVSLAPVILLIDIYFRGRPNKRTIYEYLPYFALSLFFGILALISQKASGALDLAPHFSIFDRIFLTSYTIVFYIFKFFVPIKLSAFHPYPLKINGYLPIEFYLSFFAITGIIISLFKAGKFKKTLITGTLLYFIPITLVLQIIPAGRTIVSERFSYISYLGIIFIVVNSFDLIKDNYKKYVYLLARIYLILFCFVSYNRVKVWKDSYILYSDVSEKYPYSYYAFWTKANSKYLLGDYETALKDYHHTLELNPSDDDSYLKIGNIHFRQNNYQQALESFINAIKNNPRNDQAYNNAALTFEALNQNDNAIAYFSKAIQINPSYVTAWVNRGNLGHKMGQYSLAILDFNKANMLLPNNADILGRIGRSYSELGKLKESLVNFNASIAINPNNPEIYMMRGIVFDKTKDFNKAIIDFTQALQMLPNSGAAYFFRGNSKFQIHWQKEACSDWKKSYSLNYMPALEMLQLNCK